MQRLAPFAAGMVMVAALSSPGFVGTAAAEQVVLRGVSAFPQNTFWSMQFEKFIGIVNDKGKGQIQINYLGGAPKVMDAFEVGKNTKSGVVDISSNTSGYYVNLVPEVDALKLSENTIQELRRNGGWAFLNKLHEDKGNMYFLARSAEFIDFHIYLNKEIDKADLKGMKIRVSPITRPVVEALGGTAITSPPSEVYTMLERGTVDGYGWPIQGIFDFSWQRVTKYRVEPGVYNGDLQIVVNLDRWKKLTDAQRKVLTDAALQIEGENKSFYTTQATEEKKKQDDAGMKALKLPDAEAKKLTQVARDAGWAVVMKNTPENGPKLKDLLTKK